MTHAPGSPNASGSATGAVWAALGGSVATLLCCVLPSLLVLAGLGATVAAVTSALPWLVTLSRNKHWVFLVAGVLIVASRVYADRVAPKVTAEGAACPPTLGRWTRRAWWASVILYVIGLAAVYVVGPLLLRAGGP